MFQDKSLYNSHLILLIVLTDTKNKGISGLVGVKWDWAWPMSFDKNNSKKKIYIQRFKLKQFSAVLPFKHCK